MNKVILTIKYDSSAMYLVCQPFSHFYGYIYIYTYYIFDTIKINNYEEYNYFILYCKD